MTATSFAPRTGRPVSSTLTTTPSELAEITAAAAQAADVLRRTSPAERQHWLHEQARMLDEHVEELVEIADEETALGRDRLVSELLRTRDQTRFYGDVAREGSYLEVARDESALLARMNVPLGPVAVFGASNFPFVLGVIGHDTAAALAAGCPVVAKAHDAHLGLSLRLAELTTECLSKSGAPVGAYSLIVGFDAGVAVVKDPSITAVAFTGSERGGRAIWAVALERPVPIPVYAEMGTVNPVVVTRAAAGDMEAIARGFVGCYTNCSGQYCSKPGLLFAPPGSDAAQRVADALAAAAPAPLMLTREIADSVRSGLKDLNDAGASTVVEVGEGTAGWSAPAAVLRAPIDAIRPGSRLLEECFGAVAVVIEYPDDRELLRALQVMQPALVAAVWARSDGPDEQAPAVMEALAGKVGRVVVNGWTTGAPHSWAQNHGGPWPATSNPQGTSIGAAALHRFVRPVAYQQVPEAWLPEAVKADNPCQVTRRVNGRLEPSPHIVP